MIQIRTLTKQEYENIGKIQNSEFCFYENEKDICQIISHNFVDSI